MAKTHDIPIIPPTPSIVGEAAAVPDQLAPGDGPMTMQRRLWFLLPLALLSVSVIWGGVLQALLARQVNGFVPDTSAQAGVLGLVLTVGAISSVVFTPVVGLLSDRTRTRFLGRRNSWILGGAIVSALTLLATAFAPNAIILTIAWALALIPLNGYQAAASAVVPERVPVRIRARLTAVNGMAALVGVGVGAVIGNLVGVGAAYIIFAVQLVVVGALFAFFTRDFTPPAIVNGVKAERTRLPGFRSAPDFWWVFIGRFLAFLGYGLATGLALYALRDWFKAGDGTIDAATALNGTVIVPISTLLLIVSAITGGILADKFHRMKPFVIGSSLLFIPAALVLMLVPNGTGAVIGMCLLGFGFGSYVSVDGALVTLVIPKLEDAGRDLGILNIANAGPQVIAPVIAGSIVAFAGFGWLFALVIAVSIAASIAVMFVKSVR
ncbi:MFS transporter [Arthrobacter sp. NPDC056691]|uniref:MFS transporter n=1 Tax=Arthrobacter sp. NPDC056691 TaxID=3345913 RepID=UPI003671F5EC